MNFIVVLIIAALVIGGWLVGLRYLGPKSRLNQQDPVNAEQRSDWLRALRDLAFFFILYFALATALLFAASFIVALIDPVPGGTFIDAFGRALRSSGEAAGVLNPLSIWGALVGMLTAVIAVLVSQRVARRRTIRELGLGYYKALPLDVVFGLVLGPLLFALIWQFEIATGIIVSSNGPKFDWGNLALSVGVFACVAVAEELVVRGYILQTLDRAFGGYVAVIGSSIFWGLNHLLNPNSGLVEVINITFAGLIFAYAYIITGHLWLPIVFHFSWNFAEGAIFGYPVSGFSVTNPIYSPLVDGVNTVTGARFGPEGGVVGLFAILIGGLLLYGWNRTRQPAKVKKL